jgi:L,D-peptidoglycan transpeptidase YkuD (ErfK/YbiS/YcfS/YnhG family)
MVSFKSAFPHLGKSTRLREHALTPRPGFGNKSRSRVLDRKVIQPPMTTVPLKSIRLLSRRRSRAADAAAGGEGRAVVRALSPRATRGRLTLGAITVPCALGRAGLTVAKREGDGKTVVGRFPLLFAFYRADRMARPRTRLPLVAIEPGLGWCDDPRDAAYNRPVALPFAGSHEAMWRDDGLYDVVVVPQINLAPASPGRGSALFFHLARPGYTPTEGCVAVSRRDMLNLLARIGPETVLSVEA